MLHNMSVLDLIAFQNQTERGLGLDDVLERVVRYVADVPAANYNFIIGTDSQAHRGYTKFATGVVIHRLGHGAWACYRQLAIPRELTTIREKLMLETILSQRVACHFNPDTLRSLLRTSTPNGKPGGSLQAYIDIDAGTVLNVNRTAEYVHELAERVQTTGSYSPRVKPYAYAASAYANRYTKKHLPVTTIS
jgi:predicted RNase H-related nuclease YkuK (DUF458 family)